LALLLLFFPFSHNAREDDAFPAFSSFAVFFLARPFRAKGRRHSDPGLSSFALSPTGGQQYFSLSTSNQSQQYFSLSTGN
jgi:hypothetical protein